MSEFVCIKHIRSKFIEGNVNMTILEDLCLVYNALYSMNMKFTNSLSNSNSNLYIENMPMLVYNENIISKQQVYTFLKSVSNVDKDLNLKEEELIQLEIFENKCLNDLQLCIDTFNYMILYKKRYFLWNLLKFLYQPVRFIKVFINDGHFFGQISRHLGITSKGEVLMIANI
jgi:hypothetical protein